MKDDLTSLILWDAQQHKASALPIILSRRDSAVARAAILGRCETPQENERVCLAITSLDDYLAEIEAARRSCKQPFWDACIDIDQLAKPLAEDAIAQRVRLGRLAGDFTAAEEARLRSAEALRLADLQQLERDREELLSHAPTIQQQEAVRTHFAEAAASLPKPEAARADGQVLREEWDIMITDAMALAQAFPGCVKIEPKLIEIKALLNAGQKIPGVTAVKRAKVTMRKKRQQKGQQLDI